MSDCDMSDGV